MQFNRPLIEEDVTNNFELSDGMKAHLDSFQDEEDTVDVKETEDTQTNNEEQKNVETEEQDSEDDLTEYEKSIKELYSEGLITELPQGVDEIPDLATYNKVIKYNENLRAKELEKTITNDIYTELEEKLDPFTKQILSFSLDAQKSGGDVLNFAKALLYTTDISALNLEDPKDIEDIVYQFLSATMEEDEANDMLETLKENPDKLKAAAVRYKPKLEDMARKEAIKEIEQQKLIENEESQKRDILAKRVSDSLQKGVIDEIPLTKEDAAWLYHAMLNHTVPTKIKGQTVNMEVFDYLGYHHRYNEKGNIDTLMTALLYLKDPEKVKEHFRKEAKKDVVKEVRNDNTFSSNGGLIFNKQKVEPQKAVHKKRKFELDI